MNEYEVLSKILFEKYGKIQLTTEETAEIVGRKKSTLETDRAEARGIPYSKCNGMRGQVMYSITAIAKHLIDNQIKTI